MQEYEIGLYGLGFMGSSLAKNMIQHGFDVALYSKPEAERAAFRVEAPLGRYEVFPTEEAFVHSLSPVSYTHLYTCEREMVAYPQGTK